jgi:ribosomal protein L11 methyltransferase
MKMGRYFEVSLHATSETEEALGDFLFSEGALGLVAEDLPGEPPRKLIRASFSESLSVDPLVEGLRRYQDSLAALGFSGADARIVVHELPIEDWERINREQFEPLLVGRRLVIAPPWHQGPLAEDRLLIRINPAMTFGTGYATTTRMCLEALEAFMDRWPEKRGPMVLDVGTGTGILAIAAAALGAQRVVAVDTDPDACAAARENLALHDCADRVQIIHGGIEDVGSDQRFDMVLANLDARILPPLFHSLTTRLAPAGRLIVGGIMVKEEGIVTPAMRASHLRTLERRTQGEWLCLTLVTERG